MPDGSQERDRGASALLIEAAEIVRGTRQASHGEKERSFGVIARFWQAYLEGRRPPSDPISARDAAQMMVLLKIARSIQGNAERDHFLDEAGYAAIAGELAWVEIQGPAVPAPASNSATVGVSWSEGAESLPEEPPTPVTKPAPFTFWYLATPYISARPAHSARPAETAALVRSLVVFRGIPVFCPVVHSQGWASTGRRPNYEFWVKTNEPFMRAAGGLIVATMEGWSESRDVDYAIALFRSAGKPVLCWDPISAPPLEKLRKHMGPA